MLVHKMAYPLLEWQELVARCRSDERFALQVQAAKMVTSGDKTNTVPPEQFQEGNVCGHRIEQEFTFHALDEIEAFLRKTYGDAVKAKDLKLPLETLVEDGVELRGLLLRDTSKPRKVIKYSDSWTHFCRMVHQHEQTFRRDQGEDKANWFRNDLKRTLPKAFFSAPKSDTTLASLLQRAVDEKRAEDEKDKLVVQDLPAPSSPKPAEPAPMREVEKDASSPEAIQECSPNHMEVVRPSDRGSAGAKRKAKERLAFKKKKEKGALKTKKAGMSAMSVTVAAKEGDRGFQLNSFAGFSGC